MSTQVRYLRLYLHQPTGGRRPIGFLSEYGDLLRVSFDEGYIEDPNRPRLSLALAPKAGEDARSVLRAQRDLRLVNGGLKLPSYLSNLLPEGANRQRLADQRGCDPQHEFELLAAAGHDLFGALEVEPARDSVPADVRHWHTTMGLDVLEPGFVETPIVDGASLSGVVTKFSAIQAGRRYTVKRHDQAGSFIIKLPTTAHPDLVANEITGYRLCQAVGLHCAQALVVPSADVDLPEAVGFPEVLVVSRFDRGPAGQRIHAEEFAQAMGLAPRQKYGTDLMVDFALALSLLNTYTSRPADVAEFVGRFVAFIGMGNVDAHFKNWALIYPDGRTPCLSPLYDPVCVAAFFPGSDANTYGHNKAVDRRLRAFSWDDLQQLLTIAGIRSHARVLAHARRTVSQAKKAWPQVLETAPPAVRETVLARIAGGVALFA
jgi:serine/threonine-protein kinase HipA